jgi:hypothetical protein
LARDGRWVLHGRAVQAGFEVQLETRLRRLCRGRAVKETSGNGTAGDDSGGCAIAFRVPRPPSSSPPEIACRSNSCPTGIVARRKCRLRRLSARDETRDRLRANLVGDLIPECGVATGSVRRFPEDLLVATMFVPEPARRVQCVQRCGRRGDKQHGIDFEGTLVIGPVSSTTRRARLQVGYLSTVGEDRQKQLHLWGLLRCLTTARSVWHLCSCIKLRSMNTTVKRSSMRC